MMSEEEISRMAKNPDRVMMEIQSRAHHMSHVLMGILEEPKGEPHWGLND